jgi:putative transposase
MSRPLRLQFPGALYHVMARGNARADVFIDREDRLLFLDILWKVCAHLDWQVWAYCLMGNHYHLVIQTHTPTLSRGMRDLNGVYSQAFNRRHARVGHVFQGRYRTVLVDKDGYLLELVRYILLNPVRSGLCRAAHDWPWSSYLATTGLTKAPARLTIERLLQAFGDDDGVVDRFIGFVEAGLSKPAPTSAARLASCLGDETFVAAVAGRVGPTSPEVPRNERAWKTLEQYEAEATSRDEAIRAAHASGTYTLAEIGHHFGLHYVTVGGIVRKAQRGTLRSKT